MICSVCKINELKGYQKLYCSSKCEKRGWRDKNPEKMLAARKRYREKHKEQIALYGRLYKRQVPEISIKLSKQLKSAYSCLRCGTNEAKEIHHIKHQKLGGGHNDLNNVIVLCKDCHARWHKFFNLDYWKI